MQQHHSIKTMLKVIPSGFLATPPNTSHREASSQHSAGRGTLEKKCKQAICVEADWTQLVKIRTGFQQRWQLGH